MPYGKRAIGGPLYPSLDHWWSSFPNLDYGKSSFYAAKTHKNALMTNVSLFLGVLDRIKAFTCDLLGRALLLPMLNNGPNWKRAWVCLRIFHWVTWLFLLYLPWPRHVDRFDGEVGSQFQHLPPSYQGDYGDSQGSIQDH